MVIAYLCLNRLDEAKATAHEAQARNLDTAVNRMNLYAIHLLQHDAAGMEREAASLMGKPGYEDTILYVQSETAAYTGQFAKARDLVRRASDSAQQADEKETAAGYTAESALREALVGNMRLAEQGAQAALALANGKDVEGISALALGLAGDSVPAARLANDIAKRFAEDSAVQFEYLPLTNAALALRGAGPGRAVEALATAAPYELGNFTLAFNLVLYPAYLRGHAYLAARQGAPAAAEFRKILDHPALVIPGPIASLAHLGLRRACVLTGDTAKARAAYQDFLALWKDADPDLPVLKQAKAEYAKLT